MKYWLFQNNQVAGPYDRDELAQVNGFSPESLVCPEGRRGTEMGDWSRAGVLPELAEALLRAPRVATVARGGSLPPEPTLRDLAVLGTLQEKTSLLENVVTQFQEDLRSRDLEISRLKVDLSQKERAWAEVQSKLSEMETSIVALTFVKKQAQDLADKAAQQDADLQDLRQRLVEAKDELRQDIAKTADEEKASSARIEEEDRRISGLQQSLEALQQELSQARGEKRSTEAKLADQELQLREMESRLRTAPPPVPEPVMSVPLPIPAPEAAPPPLPIATPEPVPSPEALVVPLTPSPTGPTPLFEPSSAPMGLTDLSASGKIEPAGPTDLSPGLKPRRQSPMTIVAVILAVAGAAGLYMMMNSKPTPTPAPEGVFKTGEKTGPAAAAPASPEPVDPSQGAVDFAKAYKLPDGQALGVKLETSFPSAGGLSPWMVEKNGDDNFDVRYYHSGTSRKTMVFEFTVRPKAGVLQGNNPAAVALLNGESPVPAPPKGKARRRGAKAARGPLSGGGDILIVPKDEGGPIEQAPPAGKPKSSRKAKASAGGEQSLDELLLPGLEQPVKTPKKK